jgi:hypothetical protein
VIQKIDRRLSDVDGSLSVLRRNNQTITAATTLTTGTAGGWTSSAGKVVLSTASDKVGLNVASPSAKLDIAPSSNNIALQITGGSNTGADATTAINLSHTFNTSGNPTFFKANITNTAGGVSANVFDWQLNGASAFTMNAGSSAPGAVALTVPKDTAHTVIGMSVFLGDTSSSAYTGGKSYTGLYVQPNANASSGTPYVTAVKFDMSKAQGTLGYLTGMNAFGTVSSNITSTATPNSNASVIGGYSVASGTATFTNLDGFQASFDDGFGGGAFNCTQLCGFRYTDSGSWGGGGGTVTRLYGILIEPDTSVGVSSNAFWAGAFGGNVEIDNGYRLFWAASNATAIASRASAIIWNAGGSSFDFEVATTARLSLTSKVAQFPNGTTLKSTQTTKPTIAAGAALGTGPTVTVANGSTDICGKLNITAGTSTATGTAFTVTFNGTFGGAPKMVIVGDGAAKSPGAQFYVSNITTTTFVVSANVAPTASSAHDVYYFVVE